MDGLFKTHSRSLILLLVLVITGCGFHLRGALDISSDISPVYIQQGSAFELAREITSLLEKNNVVIADNPSMSSSQLKLVSESRSRRVLSVDSSGRAIEYLLTYSADIIIKTRQAKEVQDKVSLSRSLVFDPDAVLAAANEAETLYRDMRKDAARLVLLKLQARAAASAITDENEAANDSAVKTEGASAEQNNGSVQ